MLSRLKNWLFGKKTPSQTHIWKEVRRENLGSYMDWGTGPLDANVMYRIAVHEKCILTGGKRVREIKQLFPHKEN